MSRIKCSEINYCHDEAVSVRLEVQHFSFFGNSLNKDNTQCTVATYIYAYIFKNIYNRYIRETLTPFEKKCFFNTNTDQNQPITTHQPPLGQFKPLSKSMACIRKHTQNCNLITQFVKKQKATTTKAVQTTRIKGQFINIYTNIYKNV